MFNGSREVRERLEALERKHRELVEGQEKLTRHIDLDWPELLDKVHRWMQRTGARDRAEAKAVAAGASLDATPGVDPVSAQLLARRQRGRPMRAVEDEGSVG